MLKKNSSSKTCICAEFVVPLPFDMFKLESPYKPPGDQPEAIKALVDGINAGAEAQVLLGVTGSGKTFTVANVIQELNRPTLIMSHNKTLAAQLYSEMKAFFPHNAVEYFVSYYDYYQPEAYIPSTDLYIEKDLSINEEIDRLRLSAVAVLLSGRNYTLPTEAQWEYAARGGIASDGSKYAGSDLLDNIAWYSKNGFATHPCGEKEANALGIFDMSGNVAEWCKDWYTKDSKRSCRGGSFEDSARNCRVSSRGSEFPNIRTYNTGFRVICIP